MHIYTHMHRYSGVMISLSFFLFSFSYFMTWWDSVEWGAVCDMYICKVCTRADQVIFPSVFFFSRKSRNISLLYTKQLDTWQNDSYKPQWSHWTRQQHMSLPMGVLTPETKKQHAWEKKLWKNWRRKMKKFKKIHNIKHAQSYSQTEIFLDRTVCLSISWNIHSQSYPQLIYSS